MTSAAQPRPARSKARQHGGAARVSRVADTAARQSQRRIASSSTTSAHGAVRTPMATRGSALPRPKPERRPDSHADGRRQSKTASRPALRVIDNEADATKHRIASPVSWSRRVNKPMMRIVIAIVVLVASMSGALALRTLMIEDSFTLSTTKQNISQLQQDVEADELQLEQLNADLPNKATQMGMVPGSGSVTLDMGQGSQSSTSSHDATDSGSASADASASASAQGQAQ